MGALGGDPNLPSPEGQKNYLNCDLKDKYVQQEQEVENVWAQGTWEMREQVWRTAGSCFAGT